MKLLLLFLWAIFFGIFFIFSQQGFQSFYISPFIEGQIYIGLCIFAIIWISVSSRNLIAAGVQIEDGEDYELESPSNNRISINFRDIFELIKRILSQYVYYIAGFFFYFSLYLLMRAMFGNIDISYIFFFFNMLVLGLYFFEDRLQPVQDFLRVNTIIISAYYIFFHLGYLFWMHGSGNIVDILNVLGVFLILYVFLSENKKSIFHESLASYGLIFSVLEITIVAKIFSLQSGEFLALLSFFCANIFFVFTSNIAHSINIPKSLVRIWWLVASFMSVSLFSYYVFQWAPVWSFLSSIALWFLSWVLYRFHYSFQNYGSLFISSLACIFSFIGWVLLLENDFLLRSSYYLFLVSIFFLVIRYGLKFKYFYDIYFLHSISLAVNILALIFYFAFWEVSLLSSAVFLFGESLYLFYSYYSLRAYYRLWK